MQSLPREEQFLLRELAKQPSRFENRFTHAANCDLREILFRSLARHRNDYLRLFFPQGLPADRSQPWILSDAQGALEGAEYTAAAKGTPCGHIFKSGENTYHCRTCSADDTCVLCAKCFGSSNHDGHTVMISISPGNSGCCDCGDKEAWRREMRCSIHTADSETELPSGKSKDKQKAPQGSMDSRLPADLVESMRMTIGRCIDYLCDVFSCSPEQLRLPKSQSSILRDERESRLASVYGDDPLEEKTEYTLVLWNDEKHTVNDVQNQVARACQKSKSFGFRHALEVNEVGRSIIEYSTDLEELLRIAEIIEQIKVSVTIRAARDIFREQMCATIIDWISDIAGCCVGSEPYILRNIVCEELLKPWKTGSQARNRDVGQAGIYDHQTEDIEYELRRNHIVMINQLRGANVIRIEADTTNDDEDEEAEEIDENYDEDMDIEEDEDMTFEVDDLSTQIVRAQAESNGVLNNTAGDAADMDIDIMDDAEEMMEATYAGYPPPPPPPPQPHRRRRIFSPQESEDGENDPVGLNRPYTTVPQTPKAKGVRRLRPSKHWLEKPEGYRTSRVGEPCEDLWQRVRLDFLILYDLRLWKILRTRLRHLFITTVVTIPHFKRILGLRFAGLYTALAQLYLIADREPDHSIINLSVQMLTTPTITQEVVERGNFLTNLMAILYTFITTRQVGFPEDVHPKGTLAFDSGAVTNRRMYHFFLDLRWLFRSELIHRCIRFEPRYLLQFLDLVKLHQGICPNVRATSEHVEYESDAWMNAQVVVKEINKLCKQVAVAFEPSPKYIDHSVNLRRALRTTAQVTMINAFGYERKRFSAAELKDDLAWHVVGPFDATGKSYSVPRHVVHQEPMSFHHPLHYVLSWLIEDAKDIPREEIQALLHFQPADLKDPWNMTRSAPAPSNLTSDELLSGIFDHPLRVCVWLAQQKAGMWVRNGITLRHQALTYRSVSLRDTGYQRDILMVQAGLVLCGGDDDRPGERFLAQMLDRFQMTNWVRGEFGVVVGFEEAQQIDVFEDFFHLLVIALCERNSLIPGIGGSEPHMKILQQDIIHALCFKPLSFSELAARVTEKTGESDDFNRMVQLMTVYRAPEGLSDSGTFELKREYLEHVNPYYAHFSRNHREEADTLYRKHMAQKSGKKPEDIVFEPQLEPIKKGLFSHLASFTSTTLFVQVIGAALNFAVNVKHLATKVQPNRVETFLHMALHLLLIAVLEDRDLNNADKSFIQLASSFVCKFSTASRSHVEDATVVELLATVSRMEEYASCQPAIKHILRKMQLKQPGNLVTVAGSLAAMLDRADAGSPASLSAEDKERKKQEALARTAKVMAQMKQQQSSFLQNQGLAGFDIGLDDIEDEMSITEESENADYRKTWSFPTGTCILCQEETDDQRLYGTFAFFGESDILRHTPVNDSNYIKEVLNTPESLDRSAEHLRPFGVASSNKRLVTMISPTGEHKLRERQELSRGFPHQKSGIRAPLSTSCGHIMHYACFENYLNATQRRHTQQVARNHPERTEKKEFVCPLCKALGNAFLPIIWKAKECAHDHELHAAKTFSDWLSDLDPKYSANLQFLEGPPAAAALRQQQVQDVYSSRSFRYVASMFAPSLAQNMNELTLESSNSPTSPPHQQRYPLRRSATLSRFLGIGYGSSSHVHDLSQHPQSPPVMEQSRMTDVLNAYDRISGSIVANELARPEKWESSANPVTALSRALGCSISAFEISHRGMGDDPFATSLLAALPEQALTHFRIMSETIESKLALGILKSGSNVIARETVKKRDVMTAQLFGTDSPEAMVRLQTYVRLLFQDDIFLFFADWLSFMAPTVAEASCILQLCYWAEIVKTAFVYLPSVQAWQDELPADNLKSGEDSVAFGEAMKRLEIELDSLVSEARPELDDAKLAWLRMVIDKYSLPFLRKATLLMSIRYGLDFECPFNIDPVQPELQRLTAILHIPTIDELCSCFASDTLAGETLRKITSRWFSQAQSNDEAASRFPESFQTSGSDSTPIRVPHPAIFELVGLPKTYDSLTEEAMRWHCPTTGKEISDPALCLMCGEIFCSQALCCQKDRGLGGCSQHMLKHALKTGVFINIRKCMILFTHGPNNGSFAQAPYLDKYGETDPTLRKHQQLFLNQKRYDKLLRDVWLGGMIPTVVSRKTEAEVNPGGWLTL